MWKGNVFSMPQTQCIETYIRLLHLWEVPSQLSSFPYTSTIMIWTRSAHGLMNVPRFCAMCFFFFYFVGSRARLLITWFGYKTNVLWMCMPAQSWGGEHVVWSEVRKCYDFGAKNLSLKKKHNQQQQQKKAFIWWKQGAHFKSEENKNLCRKWEEEKKRMNFNSHNIHQSGKSERTIPRSLNHLTFHLTGLKIDINWRFDYLRAQAIHLFRKCANEKYALWFYGH